MLNVEPLFHVWVADRLRRSTNVPLSNRNQRTPRDSHRTTERFAPSSTPLFHCPCHGRARRKLQQSSLFEQYNETVDAGTDVLVATAGYAALESALPSTVRIVSEGFVSTRSDTCYPFASLSPLMALFYLEPSGDMEGGLFSAQAVNLNVAWSVFSSLWGFAPLSVHVLLHGRIATRCRSAMHSKGPTRDGWFARLSFFVFSSALRIDR